MTAPAPALLVTVRGRTGWGDFAVVADVPTARLAAALAAALGDPGPGPWALAPAGAPCWDGRRTLLELAVRDGAEVDLRPEGDPVSAARS